MNSEIFVHAQTNIQNASAASSQPKTTGNSIPAVIRPVKRSDGKTASARLDAAEAQAIPTPHVRTHQLDDYVNWLRVRVAAERAAKKVQLEGSSIETRAASENLGQRNEVAERNVVTELTSALDDQLTKSSEANPAQANTDSTIPQPSSGQIVRVDGAQSPLAGPSLPANQYKIDPDLARISAMLESTEAESVSAEKIVAIDPSAAETITELVSQFDGLVPPARATVAPLPIEPLNQADTDQIIKTVSEAIASVLTDQSTGEIEGKIRTQLDLSSNALDSLPSHVAEQIHQDVEDVAIEEEVASDSKTVTDLTSKVSDVDSNLHDQEIPTSIAAWDVVDFRWPKVTDHMVTSGADAIGSLTDSVFKLLGTGTQRIAVTGTGRGEGTTSIAISLARSAAAAGKKTLLVDADLASPGLSSQVGLGPNISWINAVNDALDPSEVIIRSQSSPLCVMPMSPIVTRVTWPRFIYDLLGDVASKVQSKFDLIIFDVGPASQLIAELSRPELLIDASLIVDNGANSAEFLKTQERLESFGITKYLVAQNTVQNISANVA